MNKLNILVATPAYNSLIYTNYFVSAAEMMKSDIPVSFDFFADSMLCRARDSLISEFYRLREFSHLLFLDADVGLENGGLKKLLDKNVNVVGAPYLLKHETLKIYNEVKSGNHLTEKDLDGSLLEVDYIGTGCLLLSRKAVDALVEDAIKKGRFYKGRSFGIYDYNIFRVGINKDKIYLTEDWYLCDRLKELGYKIYTDTGVKTTHMGLKYKNL